MVEDEERKRQTQTRRINCPFDAYIAYYQSFSMWGLTVRNASQLYRSILSLSVHF
jgi:hypothetical protein